MSQLPTFSPSIQVATPGMNLAIQETQFDQLRSVLLGAGTQAARAFAAEGTRNQQMEALRDRARQQSEARQAQVSARFDQANMRAAAAEQQRQAGLQKKRMDQISDKQMSLQLRARERGPEWLLQQATAEFNNAANTDERRAWFGLLNQSHEMVQQSEIEAERKQQATTLMELSMAGDTAKKATDILIGELQADSSLREELIGDGTNIHSRVLEYVIGEAASVAPDLFNQTSEDPAVVRQSQDLINQLERQAIRVGDALIQEHTRNAEGANERVGLQQLEAIANSYLTGAGIEEIELDGIEGQQVMGDALDIIRREHFNHLPFAEWEKVVDGFVTEAAVNLGRLANNITIQDAIFKLDELEEAFPQRSRVIADARDQMENSIQDRLANRSMRQMSQRGINNPNPDNVDAVTQIIQEQSQIMEAELGATPDADMTDSQTRMNRVLRASTDQILQEFTGQAQQMAARRRGAELARRGLEGGDVSALWEEGVQFAVNNNIPLSEEMKSKIVSQMDNIGEEELDTVLTGLKDGSLLRPFDPDSVEGSNVDQLKQKHEDLRREALDAVFLAEAEVWEEGKTVHKPLPDEMIDSAFANLQSLEPETWRRYMMQLTVGFEQTNRDEFLSKLGERGPEGSIIRDGLLLLGAKSLGEEVALSTVTDIVSRVQERLTNPEENTTSAFLERIVLDQEGRERPLATRAGAEIIRNRHAIDEALLKQVGWSGESRRDTLSGRELQERLTRTLEESPFDIQWMRRVMSSMMMEGTPPEEAAARTMGLIQAEGYAVVDRRDRPGLVFVGDKVNPLGEEMNDHEALSRRIQQDFASAMLFRPDDPGEGVVERAEIVAPSRLQTFRGLVEDLDFTQLRETLGRDVDAPNTISDAAKLRLIQQNPDILMGLDPDEVTSFLQDETAIEYEPDWSHQSWNRFVSGGATEDGMIIPPQVPIRVRVNGHLHRLTESPVSDVPLLFWHNRGERTDPGAPPRRRRRQRRPGGRGQGVHR